MLDIYSSKFLDSANLPDYQMANLWILELPVSPFGLGASAFTGETVITPGPNPQFFDLHVVSTSLPLRKLELEKTSFNTIFAKGRAQYSTFSVTFRETIDFRISKYFENWMNNFYDFDKQVYKKNFITNKSSAILKFIQIKSKEPNFFLSLATVVQQLNTFQRGWEIFETSSYELINFIPVGFGDLDLDNDTGEPLNIEVEFQVENVVPSHERKSIAEGSSVFL